MRRMNINIAAAMLLAAGAQNMLAQERPAIIELRSHPEVQPFIGQRQRKGKGEKKRNKANRWR